MQQELLIAIIAGLGGMFGWGFADFFAKKTIDRIGPISSLAWAHLFGTIILSGIAFFQVLTGRSFYIPDSPFEWGWLMFFGVLQMVVYWLVYEGFGKGQLAVLNPVFASFSGLVVLFSFFLFGEIISTNLLFLLALIFAGVILLNIDISGIKSKRLNIIPGLKEVGFAAVLAAVWTLGWDVLVGGQDFVSYALFMYAFMTIGAFGLAYIMKSKLSGVPNGLWKILVLIGLSEIIAYVAISYGYSSTSYTSIVALISGAFSLPTIFLAKVFLKEKTTIIQNIGTIAIIIGIVLLAVI